MTKVSPAIAATRPSRRKFDHDAAFRFWHNPGGQRRTYDDVAAEFGVSAVAVFKAASREDSPQRAWEIEERARREADKRAVKTIEQRIREDLALIDATKVRFAQALKAGQVDASSITDFVALVKLEQVLTGGPSERLAGETGGHRRSLEEIEAELAELPHEQVAAIVDADAAVSARVLPVGEPEPSGNAEPEHHLLRALRPPARRLTRR
jgi:hypothetical protein